MRQITEETFFDAVNGTACPQTFADVVKAVTENEFTDPDEPFFFTSDGIGYSASEIKDMVCYFYSWDLIRDRHGKQSARNRARKTIRKEAR
ncbi:MAG: hypothetical protein P8012_00120 [Desulfobacterales bacterium]